MNITAQGLETLKRTNMRGDLARLGEIIRERNVSRVVIGNPLHMSGAESRRSLISREFAEKLGRSAGVPVVLWDERLTTVEAGRVLRESGISLEKRAKAVDKLSAVLLLGNYLDAQREAC